MALFSHPFFFGANYFLFMLTLVKLDMSFVNVERTRLLKAQEIFLYIFFIVFSHCWEAACFWRFYGHFKILAQENNLASREWTFIFRPGSMMNIQGFNCNLFLSLLCLLWVMEQFGLCWLMMGFTHCWGPIIAIKAKKKLTLLHICFGCIYGRRET